QSRSVVRPRQDQGRSGPADSSGLIPNASSSRDAHGAAGDSRQARAREESRMRRFVLLVALAALAIVPVTAVQNQPAVEPGFTSLFNGADFTGWRVANPDAFSIRDGAIVANGTPGHAYYDGPVENHAFRNF